MKPKSTSSTKPTKQDTTTKEAPLKISKYSNKSIVVVGNTKPHKERLKALHGKFNPHLREVGSDKRYEGWVFALRHEEAVRALVNEINGAA